MATAKIVEERKIEFDDDLPSWMPRSAFPDVTWFHFLSGDTEYSLIASTTADDPQAGLTVECIFDRKQGVAALDSSLLQAFGLALREWNPNRPNEPSGDTSLLIGKHIANWEKTVRSHESVFSGFAPSVEIREFIVELFENDLLHPNKLTAELRTDLSELSNVLGVRRDTLAKKARYAIAKTQKLLREFSQIINRVKDWAGGPVQAFAWYRSEPVPGFGDRTLEQVFRDDGPEAVNFYLDHLVDGGYA